MLDKEAVARIFERSGDRKGMFENTEKVCSSVRQRNGCSNIEYSNVGKTEKACSNVRERSGCSNVEYSNVRKSEKACSKV